MIRPRQEPVPKDDTASKLKAQGLSLDEIAERLQLEPIEVKYILAEWEDTHPKDDCYDTDGNFLVRGRCDTCGAPCDSEEGLCTSDPSHTTAIDISETQEGVA